MFKCFATIGRVSLARKWVLKRELLPIVGNFNFIAISNVAKEAHCTRSLMTRNYGTKGSKRLNEISARVMEAISEVEHIPVENMKEDTDFFKDLKLNKLDLNEIIMAVEDEFGFEMPKEKSDKMKTPSDIIKYLAENDVDNIDHEQP